MKLKALVMAGGLATRMKLKVEKPLIKVLGKPMIEYIVEALMKAKSIDEIIVAISRHTPRTAEKVRKLPVKVIETSGRGFIYDFKYAIKKLKLGKVLIIACDLPLVTGAIIDYIVKYYEKCGKPALTVAVPLKIYKKLGLKPSHLLQVDDEIVVPAGINVIDGSKVDEEVIDEDILVIEDENIAVNVNTVNELIIAEQILREKLYWKSLPISEICSKLRNLLEESVKRSLTEAILLSGGVDTSILAFIASKYTHLKAFTVAFKIANAVDVDYASLIVRLLNIEHHVYFFDESELIKSLPKVIKVVRSFDPMEVRNSIAIYIALKLVKEHGLSSVMTGDGSDELFAGYSYLLDKDPDELELELKRIWSIMEFSSIPLAESLRLEIKLPYLDEKFKNFAMKLSPEHKVRIERGRKWGKWILRKAFEKLLPKEIIWREKVPIEVGSGTTILPKYFNSIISDEEFKEKKRKYYESDGVIIRSKEQLFYYEIYRAVIGVPRPKSKKGKICPQCHSNIPKKATYCRVCGAYPV